MNSGAEPSCRVLHDRAVRPVIRTLALLAPLASVALRAAPSPIALPPHAEIRAAFEALDTSRNGAINPAEWHAAGENAFAATDQNQDGSVDRAEIGVNRMRHEVFPEADAAGDGRLSEAEFLRLREIIFRAADIDRNDFITFVEYELLGLLRRTGWHDRDDDGRIAMSELHAVLEQAFPLLDANHDGLLTGAETAFLAPAHLAAMDPKSTGRIAPAQLVNGYRFLLGADQVNRNLTPRAVPLTP